ncbi:hypothetical protein [Viscerimonas tarda]
MADPLVLTSVIFSPLQVVKKQNIVYFGRLSVTNALPVSLSVDVFKKRISHERRKVSTYIADSAGVM